jgi:predicted dehydrogenase
MVSALDQTGTQPTDRSRALRAAVVGLGGISAEHLSYLAGTTTMGAVGDRVALAAVCDLSPTAARYAAGTYRADASFTDLDRLLDEVAPDVVHVLTPPASHQALVSQCLRAGAHVICEKPITPTSAELHALLATADDNDRQLMESHNYRFNPAIVRIREAIERGQLGAVREVEIRISLPVTDPAGRFGDPNLPSPIHDMPAGVVHDFTTHLAYLLLHFVPGAAFEQISAHWNRHSGLEFFRYDDLDAVLIGSGPDGPVHARLRFDARCAPDTFTVVVRGSDGLAETDLFQPHVRLVRPRPGPSKLSPIVNSVVNGAGLVGAGVQNLGQKLLQVGPYVGLHQMLHLAYGALVHGRPFPVSPEEMMAASRLVDRLIGEGTGDEGTWGEGTRGVGTRGEGTRGEGTGS